MPGQNFASLGIDITSFSPDKEATLNRFITLFGKLDQYHGKSINPVFGPGLVDFNTSLTSTNKLLGDLNTGLTSLTTALSGTSGGSQKAAAATKELTAEQAALKVQLQEANKAILDNAKAQNASVQARLADKKAIADEKKAKADLAAQEKKDERDRAQAQRDLAKANRERRIASNEAIRAQQQESKTTEKLISDYEQLKIAQRAQATNYTNLFIAHGGTKDFASANANLQVKAAFNELQATSTTIRDIEKNLDKATQGAGAFGNSLTRGLSGLRTIAYILPGIGIAGIFNLAFEAIGKAAEELGLFTDTEKKAAENANILREALLELNDVFAKTQVNDDYARNFQIILQEYGNAVDKARGKSLDITLPQDVELARAKLNLENLDKPFPGGGTLLGEFNRQLDETRANIDKLTDRIIKLQVRGFDNRALIAQSKGAYPSSEALEYARLSTGDQRTKEEFQQQFNITLDKIKKEQELYDKTKSRIDVFYENKKDLQTKDAALTKFLEDEQRKRIIDNAKEDITVNQNKNNIILKDDISSEQEKTNSLKKLRQEQSRLNNLELYNVIGNDKLGIPANINATISDINIAKRKQFDESIKINDDFDKRQKEQDENYRQRRLKAQSEIDQSEINAGSIRDEKIANNENNSLQERLEATIRYIKAKQLLQDIQYEKDIDQEKFKSKDPTALKELEEIDSKRVEQKANIQADIEKKVYDIVYQSTQKQLKLILDENKIEVEKNKERYGQEVRELSDSYKNKQISYSKYKRELKKIDDIFQRESLDETIRQDTIAVERIRENLKSNFSKLVDSEKNVSTTRQLLINAKEGAPDEVPERQKDYDIAIGLYDGYLKAVQNGEVALDAADKKRKDDQFKRDNLRYDEDLKQRRRYFQAVKQIEESLYRTIKEVGDREYQYHIEQLSLKKTTIDEGYQSEIDAIERSSLSAKDKNALDIQLNAQKKQADVELAREEKRIKHDQAVFDRDIAIAHIILSTAEAVAASLEFPILSIAAGIAGAAELVVASSVKIPSYKEGTEDHPGGFARFGEDGYELIKEPYKSPYLINHDTIGWLPKHTAVIPIKDHPEYGGSVPTDDSWKQTMYLAKQIKKYNSTTVINNINIDFGFQDYKRRILGQ